MIGSCQHGFLNRKSCLTNLIAFCDEMSGLVDKGRAVYVDCFDLSKVFEIILHSILTKKNEDVMCGRENSEAPKSLV